MQIDFALVAKALKQQYSINNIEDKNLHLSKYFNDVTYFEFYAYTEFSMSLSTCLCKKNCSHQMALLHI